MDTILKFCFRTPSLLTKWLVCGSPPWLSRWCGTVGTRLLKSRQSRCPIPAWVENGSDPCWSIKTQFITIFHENYRKIKLELTMKSKKLRWLHSKATPFWSYFLETQRTRLNVPHVTGFVFPLTLPRNYD